jgi:hypothetical protein
MNTIFSFEEFMGGIPVKSSQATKDTVDGKAFRLGYQSAKLENERTKLNEEKILFEQQKAAVIQQLLSAQAQSASMMGAAAGATAGVSAGLGMGGVPVGPGGEIGMPPMGGAMGGGMPPAPMPGAPMGGGMPPMEPPMGGGMPPMM